MLIYIVESIIIGFISFVIGTIIFNLSINKNNKKNNQPIGIDLAFFTTGVILYFVSELLL
jgi:uncharacterized membrane protein